MLVIRLHDGNRHWQFSKSKPQLTVPELLGLKHVSACGAELEEIQKRFPSLPFPMAGNFDRISGSVTWWGDQARFIVSNL